MPSLQGLITGTLGYELKKEFLSNSLMFREVELFNYDIYSADFSTFDPSKIQDQIKNEFKTTYEGDINVKVFSTQNALQYPTDSIRASRFNVSVEIVKNISDLPDEDLLQKIINNGKNLLNFKEELTFSKNQNGNREFNHTVSFNIRDEKDSLGATGRKSLAQSIATQILGTDQNDEYELSYAVPSIVLKEIGDSSKYKNYFNESYDFYKNSYSFARRREILPSDADLSMTFNVSHSLIMNENGVIDVNEKVNSLAKVDFDQAVPFLENYYLNSYDRCLTVFQTFHNSDILLNQRPISDEYSLINIPTKLIKNYNKQSLSLGYEVTYTNNPETKNDGTIVSQIIEFSVNAYNKVEASHTFEYTINKTKNSDYSYYVTELMLPSQVESEGYMQTYYEDMFIEAASSYPLLKLIKSSASLPNIKTRASVKYSYSNSPIYFVNVNGLEFNIYEVSIDVKKPIDIVNEYKIINRPSKQNKSVLSYAYQSEKGEVQIRISAIVGKNSRQFYEDGNFSYIGENNDLLLSSCLQALYKDAGQRFLSYLNTPSASCNWFISSSDFSFDSENGSINASVNYVYTLKRRNI